MFAINSSCPSPQLHLSRKTKMVDKSAKTAGRVLLPSYVKPEKYDLKVIPDLVNYSFDGIVSIDMTTGGSFTDEESKRITLHAKELMFRKAEFKTEGGKVVAAAEVSLSRYFASLLMLVSAFVGLWMASNQCLLSSLCSTLSSLFVFCLCRSTSTLRQQQSPLSSLTPCPSRARLH